MVWLLILTLLCLSAYLCYAKKQAPTDAIELAFLSKLGASRLSPWYRGLLLAADFCSFLFFSLLILYVVGGSGPLQKVYASLFDLQKTSTTLSRKIFFILDNSGSMAEPMPTSGSVPKIDVAKKGILDFIALADSKGGSTDLLGLATFARAERILSPLTRDRAFFEKTLSLVTPETIEALNGTAIGYAIFKAATLTIACSDLKTSLHMQSASQTFGSTLILLTDGLEEPNPADESHPYRSMRALNALRFAKENHVCVDYINIDKLSYQSMAPEERDRLVEAVEATGGSYHEALNQDQVATVLQSIALQKPPTTTLSTFDNNSVIILFLLSGTILLLCLGRGLETIVLRVS